MRRVVVTGLGLVTPLATGVEQTWAKILASQSGLSQIQGFETSDLPAKVAGQVEGRTELFNPLDFIEAKELRRIEPFIIYGLAAAAQAVEDAGWKPSTDEQQYRTGVMVGSGIGGLNGIAEAAITLHEKGPRRVSPFFIPSCLINLVSGQISIKYGFKGPNHAVVTACSTGCHAIGDAARLIQYGDADVMIAGGAEGAVCRLGMAGFAALRALSTNFNDTPTKASRPWDKDRDGFVMGEGAGVVVLEEYEHAKKRGAKIYAEVLGYGLSGDAYHITAPHESGDGAYRCMKMATERAGIPLEKIGYVNAHGTSTPLGDEIEVKAVKRLFGDHAYSLAMSSTKSSTGHLLGAAGAIEAIFSILAMRDGVLPPTLNLDNPSEGCDLNFVPHTTQQKKLDYVLSNSFGFGGTNASIVLGRV